MNTLETEILLSPSSETGTLNVMHLKRFWSKIKLKKEGKLAVDSLEEEWQTDVTLLNALGLGLEPTYKYLYTADGTFEDFEEWVIETTGGPDPNNVAHFNSTLLGTQPAQDTD